MKINIRRWVLWLFLGMVVSFTVAFSLAATSTELKGIFNGGFHSKAVKGVGVPVDQSLATKFEGVQVIKVIGVNEDITVTGNGTSEIRSHLVGEYDKNIKITLTQVLKGNTLEIEVKRTPATSIVNSFLASPTLSIDLPSTYTGKLDLKAVSGDVVVSPLSLSDLQVETISGEITSSASTPHISLTTVSGDSIITNLTGSGELNSVSGEVELGLSAFTTGTLILESVSGDSEITLPGNASYSLDFSSVSGDVKESHPSGPNAGGKIKFHSVSGDLEIK